MRLPLRLHPDSRCDGLTALEVEVIRLKPQRLLLRYVPSPGFQHVRMLSPSVEGPQRRDELWRHSCFEAFIRPGDGDAYFEFNLGGSGDWAAYRFSAYRTGMEPVAEAEPPGSERFRGPGADVPAVAMVLELGRLQAMPLHKPWHVGLSAVIEEKSGRISYWALAHPPGKPDFHHPDCFALRLDPARPA